MTESKETVRKRASAYYYNNREAILKAAKDRHQKLKGTAAYKESRQITLKKHYAKNKVCIAAYRKSRAHIHKAYTALWFQENKSRLYARIKQRMASDEQFAAARRCRGRLNGILSKIGSRKAAPTMQLVGCTAASLVTHLRSNSNRTLHNSEVDHIFPVSMYDLTDPGQQRRCFHYSNLQLLSSKANKEKSDQLPSMALAKTVQRWAWPDEVNEDDLA